MNMNEIHDEVATLSAAILEGTDLYPTTDFGFGLVSGSLYAAEDYIVASDFRQGVDLILHYFIDPKLVVRIGDLTVFPADIIQIATALTILEHNHD